ncbi:hypothetical protein OAS86_05645 [Gammaproteobacteria bacterium]|nr:hypothetical protein [Gammaproteobacteria bacterium]
MSHQMIVKRWTTLLVLAFSLVAFGAVALHEIDGQSQHEQVMTLS